jgi:feruloyl esterase
MDSLAWAVVECERMTADLDDDRVGDSVMRKSVCNFEARFRRPVVAAVFAVGLLATPLFAAKSKPVACENLTSLHLADTVISSATVIPEGTFAPPTPEPSLRALPAFCRVIGMTNPAVRFEVWLPVKSWNGKFEGVGNGGTAGFISYKQMAVALRHGYATASTDTGHVNTPYGNGFDSSWARGRPDLVADFGHRGLHVTTVNAKEIVAAFYRKASEHSYYVGCSKGGGQGLMEAQRYPGDYDGLLVGDPAYNWTGLYAGSHLWYSIATLKDPESYIPASKVEILAKAVNQACDAKDGFADGVIENPLACTFDPAALLCKEGEDAAACFSAKQVKAVNDIWSGVRDSKGNQIFPGLVRGGEGGRGGWAAWTTGPAPFGGTHWKAANGFFRDMVFNDSDFNPLNFNYDTDMATTVARVGPMLNAVDPDLRPMQRRGAKLILYHGWSDPDISPVSTINYYKQVVATVGEDTPDFARLFMVPGMQHCSGGPGETDFDGLSALERWVEHGAAPEKIIASTVPKVGDAIKTRPLCPYPQVAVYEGKGSVTDATSFACRVPQTDEVK